jgi:hypothetical protein
VDRQGRDLGTMRDYGGQSRRPVEELTGPHVATGIMDEQYRVFMLTAEEFVTAGAGHGVLGVSER